MKEANPADPRPTLPLEAAFRATCPLLLIRVEGLTESPRLVTRIQVVFPWPYQGFTKPSYTAGKWGHSYQLCLPPQVPRESG